MPDTPPARKRVIGWRESVDLPDWGLVGVVAKVDTGARTSAIDVAQIEDLPDGRVRFEVVAKTEPDRITQWVTATPVRTSVVKPSHGETQTRPVCLTRVRIGEDELEIELSLVCRANMLCRMLIGRKAIAGRFVVDPGKRYRLSRKRKPRTKKPPL
ncbi:MAG: RimK/LysX family protein [Planctomycetota bacterium]